MEQGSGSGRFNCATLGTLPAELMVALAVLIVTALAATKTVLPFQIDKVLVATRLVGEALLELEYR